MGWRLNLKLESRPLQIFGFFYVFTPCIPHFPFRKSDKDGKGAALAASANVGQEIAQEKF